MKKLSKLFAITIASVLLFSCGALEPTVISKERGEAAKQDASNQFQEFVLVLLDGCHEDLKDYKISGVNYTEYWVKSGNYYVLISNGAVVACDDILSNIGTLDEEGLILTIADGVKDSKKASLSGKKAHKLPEVIDGKVNCSTEAA